MAKIPVHIITGFLGSGKTTFLSEILAGKSGENIAVIVNELGAISLDHSIIESEFVREKTLFLNAGCVCCNRRLDLCEKMRQMLDAWQGAGRNLERVIIETTGIANPAPIAFTFLSDLFLSSHFSLENIVVCVDAVGGAGHLENEEAISQLLAADIILLTKTDLNADTTGLCEQISAINHGVKIIKKSEFYFEKFFELKSGFNAENIGIFENFGDIAKDNPISTDLSPRNFGKNVAATDNFTTTENLATAKNLAAQNIATIENLTAKNSISTEISATAKNFTTTNNSATAKNFTHTKNSATPRDFLSQNSQNLATPQHFTHKTRPPNHAPHTAINTAAVRFSGAIDWSVFSIWLSMLLFTHGREILRVKGLINIGENLVNINGVGHILYPPTHIKTAQNSEISPKNFAQNSNDTTPQTLSNIIFITKNLDPALIKNSLQTFLSLGQNSPDFEIF